MGVVEAAREEVEFAGAMEGEELRPALARVPCPAATVRIVIPSDARNLSWCARVLGADIQERFLDCVPRRAHTARRKKRGTPLLGTLEPRKNVPALIAGWAAAVADLPDPPGAGAGRGERMERGSRRGSRSGARPPAPGATRLPALQRPSRLLRRSTGRRVPEHRRRLRAAGLEAMACGAPVLTTHRTALPEVGGDAVAYTEPDSESIRTALRSLLEDPSRRTSLGEARLTPAPTSSAGLPPPRRT